MHNLQTDSELQYMAINVLLRLAENSDNKLKIEEAGGINSIVAAMLSHKEDSELLYIACAALHVLADHVDNKLKIEAAGGINSIVMAMVSHKEDGRLQHAACSALHKLTSHDDTLVCGVSIEKAGGVSAILMAMEQYKEDATIQEVACGTLGNIAFNSDSRIKIARQVPCRLSDLPSSVAIACASLYLFPPSVLCLVLCSEPESKRIVLCSKLIHIIAGRYYHDCGCHDSPQVSR